MSKPENSDLTSFRLLFVGIHSVLTTRYTVVNHPSTGGRGGRRASTWINRQYATRQHSLDPQSRPATAAALIATASAAPPSSITPRTTTTCVGLSTFVTRKRYFARHSHCPTRFSTRSITARMNCIIRSIRPRWITFSTQRVSRWVLRFIACIAAIRTKAISMSSRVG